MPVAEVNGQSINYSDSGGDGAAVLFSHGFLMDHSMFDQQVDALADDYRCIDVALFVDGTPAGSGRVESTVPMIFSADETTDLGEDIGTSVSDDYEPNQSSFNGKVNWVQIDLADAAEDSDHLISPEERLRIAMARQ